MIDSPQEQTDTQLTRPYKRRTVALACAALVVVLFGSCAELFLRNGNVGYEAHTGRLSFLTDTVEGNFTGKSTASWMFNSLKINDAVCNVSRIEENGSVGAVIASIKIQEPVELETGSALGRWSVPTPKVNLVGFNIDSTVPRPQNDESVMLDCVYDYTVTIWGMLPVSMSNSVHREIPLSEMKTHTPQIPLSEMKKSDQDQDHDDFAYSLWMGSPSRSKLSFGVDLGTSGVRHETMRSLVLDMPAFKFQVVDTESNRDTDPTWKYAIDAFDYDLLKNKQAPDDRVKMTLSCESLDGDSCTIHDPANHWVIKLSDNDATELSVVSLSKNVISDYLGAKHTMRTVLVRPDQLIEEYKAREDGSGRHNRRLFMTMDMESETLKSLEDTWCMYSDIDQGDWDLSSCATVPENVFAQCTDENDLPGPSDMSSSGMSSSGMSSSGMSSSGMSSNGTTGATSSPVFTATGPCIIDGRCLQSDNYPSVYAKSIFCDFTVHSGTALYVEAFETESCCDKLNVGGVDYSGTIGPAGVVVSPGDLIQWTTDSSVVDSGFRICACEGAIAGTWSSGNEPFDSCSTNGYYDNAGTVAVQICEDRTINMWMDLEKNDKTHKYSSEISLTLVGDINDGGSMEGAFEFDRELPSTDAYEYDVRMVLDMSLDTFYANASHSSVAQPENYRGEFEASWADYDNTDTITMTWGQSEEGTVTSDGVGSAGWDSHTDTGSLALDDDVWTLHTSASVSIDDYKEDVAADIKTSANLKLSATLNHKFEGEVEINSQASAYYYKEDAQARQASWWQDIEPTRNLIELGAKYVDDLNTDSYSFDVSYADHIVEALGLGNIPKRMEMTLTVANETYTDMEVYAKFADTTVQGYFVWENERKTEIEGAFTDGDEFVVSGSMKMPWEDTTYDVEMAFDTVDRESEGFGAEDMKMDMTLLIDGDLDTQGTAYLYKQSEAKQYTDSNGNTTTSAIYSLNWTDQTRSQELIVNVSGIATEYPRECEYTLCSHKDSTYDPPDCANWQKLRKSDNRNEPLTEFDCYDLKTHHNYYLECETYISSCDEAFEFGGALEGLDTRFNQDQVYEADLGWVVTNTDSGTEWGSGEDNFKLDTRPESSPGDIMVLEHAHTTRKWEDYDCSLGYSSGEIEDPDLASMNFVCSDGNDDVRFEMETKPLLKKWDVAYSPAGGVGTYGNMRANIGDDDDDDDHYGSMYWSEQEVYATSSGEMEKQGRDVLVDMKVTANYDDDSYADWFRFEDNSEMEWTLYGQMDEDDAFTLEIGDHSVHRSFFFDMETDDDTTFNKVTLSHYHLKSKEKEYDFAWYDMGWKLEASWQEEYGVECDESMCFDVAMYEEVEDELDDMMVMTYPSSFKKATSIRTADCFGYWSEWNSCATDFSSSSKSRTYTLVSLATNGGRSCTNDDGDVESVVCGTEEAAVGDCVGEWSDYGDCVCGQMTRTYSITTAVDGGKECPFSDGATELQSDASCSCGCSDSTQNGDETDVDCGGSCAACSTGSDTGSDTGSVPSCDDGTQNGDETGVDSGGSCIVDCVGSWTYYGACSVLCGGGTQERTYKVFTEASAGGVECALDDGAIGSRECNTDVACAVDCVGSWSARSDCSVTCGGGTTSRTYTHTTVAANGGKDCVYSAGTVDEDDCNEQECSIDAADPCAGVDCNNGACVDGVCVCGDGYEGSVCDIKIDYCGDAHVCPFGYHIDAASSTECRTSDAIDGSCTDGLCCLQNCDANTCGGCLTEDACGGISACVWESGRCAELQEVDVETTFSTITVDEWNDNKEAYDTSYLEGLSADLEVDVDRFSDVTTKSGSTIASATVKSTKTAESVADTVADVEFQAALEGAPKEVKAARACSSSSCAGCTGSADCTQFGGACVWDTTAEAVCYAVTCSPGNAGEGCNVCTTSSMCEGFHECVWATNVCTRDKVLNAAGRLVPSAWLLFLGALLGMYAVSH